MKEGLPLARFGTLVSTPLTALVVLKDGPIKSIADLKGKTVGYSVAGLEDALLGTMLASAGLKPTDVTMINVNFALSPALVAGKVDAVIGAYRNFELTQIKLEGKEGLAFFPEEHGVPVFDELIYVAHKDKLGDPRLKRFLAAVEDATIYVLNHPDEAWDVFVKANPKLDDELNRTAWTDTLRRFAHAPAALDTGALCPLRRVHEEPRPDRQGRAGLHLRAGAAVEIASCPLKRPHPEAPGESRASKDAHPGALQRPSFEARSARTSG